MDKWLEGGSGHAVEDTEKCRWNCRDVNGLVNTQIGGEEDT